MRRREFLSALGGAAVVRPLAARAQQPMPVIGFMHSASVESRRNSVAAFLRGLNEGGFSESRNVVVEYRWANNQNDRLPDLATELVRRKAAVIFAGGPPAAVAAKSATATIPVVFTSGDDPIKLGLVASLNRPGGNVTGINIFLSQMESKRLGLLHELVPPPATIGILANSDLPSVQTQLDDVYSAAVTLGRNTLPLRVSTEQDVHKAFARLEQDRIGALLVCASPFFNTQRQQLVTLTAHYKIPAIYELRDYAAIGGLASYGTDLNDSYRQAGLYAARILKGDKPSDLPVMQASKFDFVINLKTAKSLGLTISPTLLARADEVIE